jgi:hypothetical protein
MPASNASNWFRDEWHPHKAIFLEINQVMDGIALYEGRADSIPMLLHPLQKIRRNADIKRAVSFAR